MNLHVTTGLLGDRLEGNDILTCSAVSTRRVNVMRGRLLIQCAFFFYRDGTRMLGRHT